MMGFRYWLADLISGGELTSMHRNFRVVIIANDNAERAFRKVASLETPNCAHVGKRMAAIAREALGE